MPLTLTKATVGSGIIAAEIHGKIFRACECGEPNPSLVECPSCGVFNYANHPCRNCNGPGGAPDSIWETCPSCGKAARTELPGHKGLLTAWYANPFKQLLWWWRERRLFRNAQA